MASPGIQDRTQATLSPQARAAAGDAEYFLEAATLRLLYYQAGGPRAPADGKMTPFHDELLGAAIASMTGEAIALLTELPTPKQREIVKGAVLKLLNGELSSSKNLDTGEAPFWEDAELRLLRSILYRFPTYVVPHLSEPDIAEAAERCLLRNLSEGHLAAADKLGGFLSREFIHGQRMQEALKLFVVAQLDQSAQREMNFREFFQAFPLNVHAAALQVAAEVQAAVGRWRARCTDSQRFTSSKQQ